MLNAHFYNQSKGKLQSVFKMVLTFSAYVVLLTKNNICNYCFYTFLAKVTGYFKTFVYFILIKYIKNDVLSFRVCKQYNG